MRVGAERGEREKFWARSSVAGRSSRFARAWLNGGGKNRGRREGMCAYASQSGGALIRGAVDGQVWVMRWIPPMGGRG
jgi:hypothetical protein